MGIETKLSGTLVSGGDAVLEAKSTVHGDVTAHGSVHMQQDVMVTGAVSRGAEVAPCQIPETGNIPTSRQNLIISKNHPVTLEPGTYGNVKITPFGKLTLKSGGYNFKSLDIGNKAELVAQISNSPLEIKVAHHLGVGDHAKVSFTAAEKPALVHIYSHQRHDLAIGRGSKFRGILTAPNAEIRTSDNSDLKGAIYGKNVRIGKHCRFEGAISLPIDGSATTHEIHPTRDPIVHDVSFDQNTRLELLSGDIIRLVGFPTDTVFNQVDIGFAGAQAGPMGLELSEGGKSYKLNGTSAEFAFPWRRDSAQEIVVLSGFDTVDVEWGISSAPRTPNPMAPPIHDLGPSNTTSELTLSEGILTISRYPGSAFNVIRLHIESRDGDTLDGFCTIGTGAIALNGANYKSKLRFIHDSKPGFGGYLTCFRRPD